MKICILVVGCAVLWTCCLFKGSDAVACTSTGVPAGCTDCTDPNNSSDPDCVTTPAATTTTTTTTTTVATVTSTSATTVVRRRRRRFRMGPIRYTAIRRIRVNTPVATFRRRNANVVVRNGGVVRRGRVVGVIVG